MYISHKYFRAHDRILCEVKYQITQKKKRIQSEQRVTKKCRENRTELSHTERVRSEALHKRDRGHDP